VNDPLRGQKAQLFEGGVRVCAFANWRGKLAPRKFTVPMHVADWFPTIASIVGYEPEFDLKWDGVNQWPALTGVTTNTSPRTIYIAMKTGCALRHGDWKLIVSDTETPQLFNIATDPYENNDVVRSYPEKVAELQKLLAEHQAEDKMQLPEDLVGLPN
jgi:arylsulfatase A-like enzyme